MMIYLLLNWAFPVSGTFKEFEEIDLSESDTERDSYSQEDGKKDGGDYLP